MQDGMQTTDNQAYTCISSQGTIEPVSEVLLGNGAILRQTYFGTEPPKEYVTSEIDTVEVDQSDRDIEEGDHSIVGEAEEQFPLTVAAEVQDEVKGHVPLTTGAGVQGEVKGHTEVKYHEVVRNGVVIAVPDSTLNGESDVNEKDKGLENDLLEHNGKVLENDHIDNEKTETVGSPYMVIQSSLVESFVNESKEVVGDQTEKQSAVEQVNETGDASRSSSFSKVISLIYVISFSKILKISCLKIFFKFTRMLEILFSFESILA